MARKRSSRATASVITDLGEVAESGRLRQIANLVTGISSSVGSNPTLSAPPRGISSVMAERLHGMQEVAGSTPACSTRGAPRAPIHAAVAQWLEHQTDNLAVEGSIPSRCTGDQCLRMRPVFLTRGRLAAFLPRSGAGPRYPGELASLAGRTPLRKRVHGPNSP